MVCLKHSDIVLKDFLHSNTKLGNLNLPFRKLLVVVKSLKKKLFRELLGLGTPKNISYFWGFGRLLGIVIVVQVFSGIFLAFYYVRGSLG
jgi:hypothetical protein